MKKAKITREGYAAPAVTVCRLRNARQCCKVSAEISNDPMQLYVIIDDSTYDKWCDE